MNGNYQNLGFNSGNPTYIPNQSTQPPFTNFPTQNTNQNSTLHIQNDQFQYAYNILNNNPNQIASFYMSYPDSVEWRDRIFTGRIIHSTREYTLLKNEETNEWYVLPSIYLNYVIFNEEVNMS